MGYTIEAPQQEENTSYLITSEQSEIEPLQTHAGHRISGLENLKVSSSESYADLEKSTDTSVKQANDKRNENISSESSVVKPSNEYTIETEVSFCKCAQLCTYLTFIPCEA